MSQSQVWVFKNSLVVYPRTLSTSSEWAQQSASTYSGSMNTDSGCCVPLSEPRALHHSYLGAIHARARLSWKIICQCLFTVQMDCGSGVPIYLLLVWESPSEPVAKIRTSISPGNRGYQSHICHRLREEREWGSARCWALALRGLIQNTDTALWVGQRLQGCAGKIKTEYGAGFVRSRWGPSWHFSESFPVAVHWSWFTEPRVRRCSGGFFCDEVNVEGENTDVLERRTRSFRHICPK